MNMNTHFSIFTPTTENNNTV